MFEAEIDFSRSDVLTRVLASNPGKRITGATTFAYGWRQVPQVICRTHKHVRGLCQVTVRFKRTAPRAAVDMLLRFLGLGVFALEIGEPHTDCIFLRETEPVSTQLGTLCSLPRVSILRMPYSF
jgi:hypothetical protein